jgi:hypothetical protein
MFLSDPGAYFSVRSRMQQYGGPPPDTSSRSPIGVEQGRINVDVMPDAEKRMGERR